MKVDFANLKRYASENEKLYKISNKGKRIILFGDSITEFWTPKNATLYQNLTIINRGISGQTTSQMVKRFQQDVVELHPHSVVILAGINDIAENSGPISLEAIRDNIIDMVDLALTSNIKVILCAVLPANHINWNPKIKPAEKVIVLNKMIKMYANNNQIPFVDYYTVMVDENYGLQKKLGEDGVHPNLKGYKLMEKTLKPFLE